MRKLALALSTFGFIAFAGIAHADQKTENSDKTDTSTTLTGKKKTTHVKKVERADGSGIETKTETTMPKNEVKRDEATPVRNDDDANAQVETKEHTTLTGKKQVKTTKKMDNADGSHTETTTTRTEAKPEDRK
jgi:hypothetical protein